MSLIIPFSQHAFLNWKWLVVITTSDWFCKTRQSGVLVKYILCSTITMATNVYSKKQGSRGYSMIQSTYLTQPNKTSGNFLAYLFYIESIAQFYTPTKASWRNGSASQPGGPRGHWQNHVASTQLRLVGGKIQRNVNVMGSIPMGTISFCPFSLFLCSLRTTFPQNGTRSMNFWRFSKWTYQGFIPIDAQLSIVDQQSVHQFTSAKKWLTCFNATLSDQDR